MSLQFGFRPRRAFFTDNTGPALVSAQTTTSGLFVVLTYNEALGASTPAAGAFVLGGTSQTVLNVLVAGNTVTLGLSGAIVQSASVTVSYTPGASPIRDVVGNNAAALVAQAVANNSTVPGSFSALYAAGAAVESPLTTLAYANRTTNSEVTGRPIATNTANGDVFAVFIRNSDQQLIVAKQTAGTGAFVETAATTAVLSGNWSSADNHNTPKCIVDDQGKLCVWRGSHSDQELYYELAAGTTALGDAQQVTPRVSGGATAESQATYHDPARLPDGAIACTWRSGGSGNGNQILDVKRSGTWSRKPVILDGTTDNVSFYFNNMCVEGASSAHPNRIWLSFQCRPSSDPTTAFGLWLIYTDDEGATWRAWSNGAALPAACRLGQIPAGAVVENIPAATANAAYSFYYGIQGMCVGLDGCPTITMYYGPATAPGTGALGASNYGDATGPLSLYAWRCTPGGSYVKQTLVTFAETPTTISRPTPVQRGYQLAVFYSKKLTSYAAGTGRFFYVTADGVGLTSPTERELLTRDHVNDVKDSVFNFDSTAWNQGLGTLKYLAVKTGLAATTTSNTPMVASVSFGTTIPAIMYPPEILSAGTAPDWTVDPEQAVDDGSGKASQVNDTSGNARHLTQSTSASRPTIITVDGKPALRFDGADDYLSLSGGLARSVPDNSANKFRVWGIVAQQSWVSGDRLWDINGALCYQSATTPNLRLHHGSAGAQATGFTVGAIRTLSTRYSGGTTDTIRVDSLSTVTGVSSGATISGTHVVVGAGVGGALPAQIDLMYLFALRRDFTALEDWRLTNFAVLRNASLT